MEKRGVCILRDSRFWIISKVSTEYILCARQCNGGGGSVMCETCSDGLRR